MLKWKDKITLGGEIHAVYSEKESAHIIKESTAFCDRCMLDGSYHCLYGVHVILLPE
jgi:hypothetical protein